MSEKDLNDNNGLGANEKDEFESFDEFADAGVDRKNGVRVEPVRVESPDVQNVPPHIKVDCNVGEEIMYPSCGCVLLFLGLFLFNFGWTPVMYLGSFFVIIGLIGILSKFFFIDNYYIIKTAERKIYYRRKVFFKTTVEPFLDAGAIFAITVNGVPRQSKTRHWWEYQVIIIDMEGEKHDFGFEVRDDKFDETANKARGIAAVLNCGFIEPQKERTVFIVKDKKRIEAYMLKAQ